MNSHKQQADRASAQAPSKTPHSQQEYEPLINAKLGKIHLIQSLERELFLLLLKIRSTSG